MNIEYINALAGFGKTRFISKEVSRLVDDGKRIILCQPTKELVDQTYLDLLTYNIQFIYKYHSSVCKNGVISALDFHFKNHTRKRQVVITTHEAFDKLPYFHRPHDWILIFDEAPKSIDKIDARIPNVHNFITDHLMICKNEEYAIFESSNKYQLKKIYENLNNDVSYEEVHELSGRILQDGWDVYANNEQYDNLITGKKCSRGLEAYAVRSGHIIQKFERCIVASACLLETFFYHVMTYQGYSFVEYPNIPSRIKAATHANGSLLSIHYLDIERWSQTIKKHIPELRQKYVNYAKLLFGSNKFLWLENQSFDDPFGTENGFQLTGTPHGLNHYRHIDNVIIIGAFNPSGSFIRFLKFIGMSVADIDRAMQISTSYQAAMRCSLRDVSSTTKKCVILPDKRTARWFESLFPGSNSTPIPIVDQRSLGIPGRPKVHGSNAARQAAYRQRKAQAGAIIEAESNQGPIELPTVESDDCYEMPNIDSIFVTKTIAPEPYILNIYESFYDSDAVRRDIFTTFDELSDNLYLTHSKRYKHKNLNSLYSTFISDNFAEIQKERKKESIKYIHSLIFDNDGGELSHHEFAELFPQLRMIIHNTWSSKASKSRWRAIIPTSRYMSVDEHKRCWDSVLFHVEAAGYPLTKPDPMRPSLKAHGFDRSKRAPNSIFYLPCQAEERGGSFFIDYNGEGRGILDPEPWLTSQSSPQAAPGIVDKIVSSGTSIVVDEDWAIDRWRQRGSVPGSGDGELFLLGVNLKNAGRPLDEVEAILREEARYAHTPKDRLAQIPRIMEALVNRTTPPSVGN
jgi:hypothetical protein